MTTPFLNNATAEQPQTKVPERIYDLYSWKQNSPDARLLYIRDPQILELELSRLQPGPLGFDLEWKPNRIKGAVENPVALVQLASIDSVLLIQLTAMRWAGFPASLQAILENPGFSKAGVNILNDCKKLWKDYGVNVRNCVDLGLLARTVDNARWKGKYSNPIGLARLCETYNDLTLTKGKVTRSNWEAVLTQQQQEYAANDCHSGLTIYNHLSPLIETIDPKPLPAYYSFDVFQGYPYQPTASHVPVMLWQPHNPFYDPGPPPPPKQPKEPKVRNEEDGVLTADVSGTGQATASSSRRMLGPQSGALPMLGLGPASEPAGATYSSNTQRGHVSLQGPPIGPRVSTSRGHSWRGYDAYGRGRGRGRATGYFTPNSTARPEEAQRM